MAATGRKARRPLAMGLVSLLVLGFVTYVAAAAPLGLPWTPHTTVKAAFDNVGSLRSGDDVRENSIQIGKVTEVSYADGHAMVSLRLDGHVPVYNDARAAIWDESALAKRFVELNRGRKDTGSLGERMISGKHNVGATDLDDLLSVFDPKTRDKLTSAVRELGTGAAGQSENLHDLLEHAPSLLDGGGNITAALSSEQAQLPSLLRNAERLVGAFNGHEQQVAQLVPELDRTLRAVDVDNGAPLRDTVATLPATLRDVRASFTSLDRPLADTRQAVSTAEPGVRSLGTATDDLRGVLREGIRPLNKVPGVANKATPAVGDLTRTLSDARPLASRLSEGLLHADPPLQVLAEYSWDIRMFFDRVNSLVSTSVAPGRHVARLGVAAEALSLVTGGVLKDPLLPRNAYPAPGQVDQDRASSPLTPVTGGMS